MKSQVNLLLQVLEGLRKDCLLAYPALRGLDLDLKRLALGAQTRGLAFFTLDLPSLDAMLIRGLEGGRLVPEGPLSRCVSKEVRVPRLFSGLWLRIFEQSACLKEDVDVTAIAFLRQFTRLGKNIVVECSPNRVQNAVREYHHVDRSLPEPTLEWVSERFLGWNDTDDCQLVDRYRNSRSCCDSSLQGHFWPQEEASQPSGSDIRVLDKIQRVADLISSVLPHYDPIELSDRWVSDGKGSGFKHGRGAVADRKKNWEKSQFTSWSPKLEVMFPYSLVGKPASDSGDHPPFHEVASRLIAVPKTAKSPRLIASESAAQMYCQQHLLRYFNESLKIAGLSPAFIDFTDQGKSASLVLRASRNQKLATVDLSSASDRLSCWLVERIFRKNPSVLCGLHAARTRYIRDDISNDPSFFILKKFASQGSATTFPVQSIVFLIIALGCSIQGDVSWQSIRRLVGHVRVYGDDIILPTHGYERLVRAMDLLYLKVNETKSFVKGRFRESCGTDGYDGYDVTPVSPETLVADSPASSQAVVDVTNNLYCKGYWNASDSLRASLPPRVERGLRIVAKLDAGFAGLTSYSGSDESHLEKRWNSRLHRYEVRVFSLSEKPRTRDRQGYSVLLDFMSSQYNPWNPRIVSEYRDNRKASFGFLWEPLNFGARLSTRGTILSLDEVRRSSTKVPFRRIRNSCS